MSAYSLTDECRNEIIEIFRKEVRDGRLCAVMIIDFTCELGRDIAVGRYGEEFLDEIRLKARNAGQTPVVYCPLQPESELISGLISGDLPISEAIIACITDGNIPVVLITENKFSFDWIDPPIARNGHHP